MHCPYCGYEEARVVDSRPQNDKIRRRRECEKCHKRFTTYEIIEKPILTVRKKDGSIEQFDREKLIHGLFTAIKKRPVTKEQIEDIADNIEKKCSESREVDSAQIGTMVMERLKAVDEVAYIRFASVYKEFEDVAGFIEEIGRLQPVKGQDKTGGKNGR
jgi:transcriptional repressor NrdR